MGRKRTPDELTNQKGADRRFTDSNRRARDVVEAIALLSADPNDWNEMREIPRIEILDALRRMSEWAKFGDDIFSRWENSMLPERLVALVKLLARLEIKIPFCFVCGGRVVQDQPCPHCTGIDYVSTAEGLRKTKPSR